MHSTASFFPSSLNDGGADNVAAELSRR
jgi:hypothetical protein